MVRINVVMWSADDRVAKKYVIKYVIEKGKPQNLRYNPKF